MTEPEVRSQELAAGTGAGSSAEWPAALTIAGSDSGGGAGIQADLKTFFALKVFGTSALTCITAQNPDGVSAVQAVDPEMVVAQVTAVCDAFPVAAAKTGMLYSAEIIQAVAKVVRDRFQGRLVVDPVMVATSGSCLLRADAVSSLCDELLPLAAVITPNLPEAEVLWGQSIRGVDDLCAAAEAIGRRFHVACVAKGGHLEAEGPGEKAVTDVLYADGATTVLTSPRLNVRETHGTGCTFSAALTAGLAAGQPLAAAVEQAKAFVARALRGARRVGTHFPLGIGCGG